MMTRDADNALDICEERWMLGVLKGVFCPEGPLELLAMVAELVLLASRVGGTGALSPALAFVSTTDCTGGGFGGSTRMLLATSEYKVPLVEGGSGKSGILSLDGWMIRVPQRFLFLL